MKATCTCLEIINGGLETQDLGIFCGRTGTGVEVPFVATYKLATGRMSTKPIVTATFCPFCGVAIHPKPETDMKGAAK